MREEEVRLVSLGGIIPGTGEVDRPLGGHPALQANRRSELEKRLLAQVCEQCGATFLTDCIEVHHIRALKDLTKYEGRQKPLWVKIMAARRRKTLVLCRTCHQDLHAGRPLRRQKSSS